MTDQISTTLAAASEIVQASALPLGDDHDAVVEIVAKTFLSFSADTMSEFVTWGTNPATAAEIVCAALEAEASADGEETASTCALTTPATASDVVQADPGTPQFQPMTAMLSIIKDVVLPLAERLAELERQVAR